MEIDKSSGAETYKRVRYLRMLRPILMLTGAWPFKVFGEELTIGKKIYILFIQVQGAVVAFAEMHYLRHYFGVKDLGLLAHVYIIGMLAISVIFRIILVSFKQYHSIFNEFVSKFHMLHYTRQTEYTRQVYNTIEKWSERILIFTAILTACAVVLFNAIPFLINFSNGVFSSARPENVSIEFVLYFYIPLFPQDEHPYFFTPYNVYLSSLCGVNFTGIDCVLYLYVLQIVGYIYILLNMMDTFPKPKVVTKLQVQNATVEVGVFDEEENREAHELLIQISVLHRHITNFSDTISNFFGPMLAANYMLTLVTGCILLLKSSEDLITTLRFLPLGSVVFGQLILTSVIFEFIGATSEKIGDRFYSIPWECMNVRNQRVARFLLAHFQKSIKVTAVGLVAVGVRTMASILRTTLSYYAFLRTMA